MAQPRLVLLAIEPAPRNDWVPRAVQILQGAGFSSFTRGQRLLIWKELRSDGRRRYANAHSLQRLWLAPKRSAIAITSKRLYFHSDDASPDPRPEREVLSGDKRPQAPPASEYVAEQYSILNLLVEGFNKTTSFVALDTIEGDLSEERIVQIGSRNLQISRDSLNQIYREYGFDHVPENFTISICPVEKTPINAAQDFARRLENVAQIRQTSLKVKVVTLEAVISRLGQLSELGQNAHTGHGLLFLLPSKELVIESDTFSLFYDLEHSKIPFRRAYLDDAHNFSIPDQFPSLLMACGGRPHRSTTVSNGKKIWTIGVDLSHGLDSQTSTLALTLVSPDGQLVGAWTTMQPRDETVHSNPISTLLRACKRRLRDLEPLPQIIVLRDGRMFENENSELYSEVLGDHLSLFEYRKRNSPQIIQKDEPHAPTRMPIAARIPDENTIFLAASPPRDDQTPLSISKVAWRPTWNQLSLTPTQISKIITNSATAPGLGLHPRNLPAAIYWADGIAGRKRNDLRFYGIPIEPLSTVA